MSGKLNTVPSYVVFDRSFTATVATIATGNGDIPVVTGTDLWRDSDLTTAYATTNNSTTLADDGQATTFDFGRAFMNCQLSYKIDFNSGTQNGAIVIEYSTDGSNWTTITSDTTAGSTKTYTNSVTILQMRYLRTRLHLGGHVGTAFITNHYEVRLMGSA